jgi:hypothetical protein
MSEQRPPEALATTDWRVIIALGSLSVYGEEGQVRITSLPKSETAKSILSPTTDEYLRIITTNSPYLYALDWRLNRSDMLDALAYAVRNTTRLTEEAGLTGVELETVKMGDFKTYQRANAHAVWLEMPNYTAVIDDVLRLDSAEPIGDFVPDNFQ